MPEKPAAARSLVAMRIWILGRTAYVETLVVAPAVFAIAFRALGWRVPAGRFMRNGRARGRFPRSLASVLSTILLGGLFYDATSPYALADQGECGQPVSVGSDPTAIDCLFILKVAVAAQSCGIESCICDPSANGSVSAADALICLNVAVGMILQPACSCTGTTITKATTTTTTLSPSVCGGAEAPACDGTCSSPNSACIASDSGCVCARFGCGSGISGRCGGLCPTGSHCTYGVEGCRCRTTASACESLSGPLCQGSCPEGSYCRSDGPDGGCRCESVVCGELAGAPECLGVCPEGFVCEESDSGCACGPS